MTARRPKILIIDDEPDILIVYEQRLNASGFEVVTAADGIIGLRTARSERPDLILLDVMMPSRSGIDVLADIRADDQLKTIPVLMLTAKSDAVTVRAVSKLGVSGYMLKTTSTAKLIDRLRELLPGGTGAPTPAPIPAAPKEPPPRPAPKPPAGPDAFECLPAMEGKLPPGIALLQIKGLMKDGDVPAVLTAFKKQLSRGPRKFIVDLTLLKWTFINAGHLKDIVDAIRTTAADVRILAPDAEMRQTLQRHRVQASIQASLKDVLDGF